MRTILRFPRRRLAALCPVMVFAFFAAGAEASSASERTIPSLFPDLISIDQWAGKSFFGGYEKHVFAHREKMAVVVIGMPTSGILTSEIAVFQREEHGEFGLVLHRARMPGIVTVREFDGSIQFLAKQPVLILPWAGISVPMRP